MERRKFILGTGAAFAGGSALLGSGAFSRVESHRSVTIKAAEDPDAYLGLDKCRLDGAGTPNSSFVGIDSDGHLEIDMGESGSGGKGPNSNSFSSFDKVFQIANQGKEYVCVDLSFEPSTAAKNKYDPSEARDAGLPYPDSPVVFYVAGARTEGSSQLEETQVFSPNSIDINDQTSAVGVPLGQKVCIGIQIRSFGLQEGDSLIDGDEVKIVADVNGDCDSAPPEPPTPEPPTPGPDFCLFPCPVDPLTNLPVPLEFDNSLLPENIKNYSMPEFREELNDIDGINLTSEVLDQNELNAIRSVRDRDSTGGIDISREAIVGPTDGENVIDVGGGDVTVSNYGAVIGTFTNTSDVVIETDSAVAGDIGVSADGGRLKGTGNVEIKNSSTVVGDINTNTDGKTITVESGGQGNRSQVFGDAITSGGKITVQYGRVSGSVETDEDGNVTVKDYSRVDGDAITSGGGQITVGNSNPSQVGGTADSTGNGSGNIDLNGKQQNSPEDTLPNEPAKVLDGVRAGGQANLSEGSVKNGVVADGDVDVDNSVVCGSVVSDGTIDIDKFSLIQEDRNASQDIGIDLDNFNIVTPTGELGTNFENFGTSTDMSTANQTIRAGSVIAGEAIDGGLQNSFVGGDVIAKNGDIDVPSSVICGDVVAENGAIDIYSTKTGPPLGLDLDGQQGGSRSQDRQRSLVGGVVRVEGEDFDIDSATVFANGTTEPDKYDDDIAVLVTQKASGGNGSTITGGSILKGDVVVDGGLNVDIDSGSRVEGKVEANAGNVSLNDVTVTGPDPGAVDDDALIIGDGGEIDQLTGGATIQGNVRVKSGGRLDVSGSGPTTIEGDLIVESGGYANRGNVTVEGDVIRK